ncbi:hypothetical protein M427DRAFT_59559 [Gonapodya prolifera JEL478]|uniref:Uncharacterized protein n=1 Tax=Gonapodya prolifera (strain JEL478) TaxID=1344416 RepID=A0A139A6L7_GONPJ|nr:hypothetical protein M427DRAFT_59559 [Gonapodya prolifera JEL478]|eukprot:KXS12411.1 hypothetical protein M427DRAFT_59559 [Gonapodya prolifera JEL478]
MSFLEYPPGVPSPTREGTGPPLLMALDDSPRPSWWLPQLPAHRAPGARMGSGPAPVPPTLSEGVETLFNSLRNAASLHEDAVGAGAGVGDKTGAGAETEMEDVQLAPSATAPARDASDVDVEMDTTGRSTPVPTFPGWLEGAVAVAQPRSVHAEWAAMPFPFYKPTFSAAAKPHQLQRSPDVMPGFPFPVMPVAPVLPAVFPAVPAPAPVAAHADSGSTPSSLPPPYPPPPPTLSNAPILPSEPRVSRKRPIEALTPPASPSATPPPPPPPVVASSSSSVAQPAAADTTVAGRSSTAVQPSRHTALGHHKRSRMAHDTAGGSGSDTGSGHAHAQLQSAHTQLQGSFGVGGAGAGLGVWGTAAAMGVVGRTAWIPTAWDR